MHITNSLANMGNACLAKYINKRIEAKLTKIRWNNKFGLSEAIYEINADDYTLYAVDVVTKEKRKLYLEMCHGKPKTISMANDRTSTSYQCSLAACFGCVNPICDIIASIEPYRDTFGLVSFRVVEYYSRKKKG